MHVLPCMQLNISPIYISFSVPSAVTNLLVEFTDDTTLVISWGPPATPNGNILSYSVSIINLKDGNAVRQENTISTTVTLTGLGIKFGI